MDGMINSILERKIEDINSGNNTYETGRVRMVRQYIVEATGLLGASYFERVIIGDSNEGYVDAIREDSVLIALTHIEKPVVVGDIVTATGEEMAAKYSTHAAGHILNIFG